MVASLPLVARLGLALGFGLLGGALGCGVGERSEATAEGLAPGAPGAQPEEGGMSAAAEEVPGAGPGSAPSGEMSVTPELPLSGGAGQVPSGDPRIHFLSDSCFSPDERNGFGPIERDLSNGEQESADGGPITVGNVVFGKGLGTHAPSEVSFDLAARCTRFSAVVGVDDEMKDAGSVRFQVKAVPMASHSGASSQ